MAISREEVLSRKTMIETSREQNQAKRLSDLEQAVIALIQFAVERADACEQEFNELTNDFVALRGELKSLREGQSTAKIVEEIPKVKPRGKS